MQERGAQFEPDFLATHLEGLARYDADISSDDLAERLGLTEKTVEAHLTRIYRKTGVRTRRELARLDFLRG